MDSLIPPGFFIFNFMIDLIAKAHIHPLFGFFKLLKKPITNAFTLFKLLKKPIANAFSPFTILKKPNADQSISKDARKYNIC